MKKTALTSLLLASLCISASAQTVSKPEYRLYKFDDAAYLQSISDNGEWAAASGNNAEDATRMTGGRVINVKTGSVKLLTEGLNADTVSTYAAYDVTNDGSMAVGQLNDKPAWYSTTTSQWHFLPCGSAPGGEVKSVTPDGRYAVGTLLSAESIYQESVALWDLTKGQLMATPGLPTKDMAHVDQKQNRFIQISADGQKVLGCMSFSYWPAGDDLGGVFYYIYDVAKGSYTPIGFTETQSGRWTAKADGLYFIADAFMSNNGQWVTGNAYMLKEVSGSQFPSEYQVPFVYNTETGEFSVYDDTESLDTQGWSIDNEGHVYAATPVSSPYRDASVRSGKYWIDLRQTVMQHYGIDLFGKMGIDNSGAPMSVSDDGLTMAMLVGGGSSYTITLPETFASVAANTNLLNSYTVTPAANSLISQLYTVQFTFTRDVQVLGSTSDVTLTGIDGDEVGQVVGFKADGKVVTVTLRNAKFEAGGLYDLTIPAGTICLSGDATRTNSAIKLTYMGRAEKPVAVKSASPKDATAVGKLDLSTSPITLNFDTDVQLKDASARAQLYQGDSTDPFAQLLIAVSGQKVLLYPATTQYLYKGSNYRVELPAGVVTDVTGNAKTANETYTLHYEGAYEREISYDENVLFEDDFTQGVANFLVLDNDHNTPSSASEAIGFTSAEYGWAPVKSSTSASDMAAASTSMYTPAGQSDDWMVIPLLNIPDQLCKLTFQSQSYHKSATDRLKVYVWESNNYYNSLTAAIVEQMRTEGKLVYDEVQSPGADEETLEGDWRDNSISLKDFAGKNVYIAFVNDNNNQSAVFVDNVQVLHELPFYVAVTSESTVVGQKAATIAGTVDVRDADHTYSRAELTLSLADGTVVDRIVNEGLSLTKGSKFDFEFTKQLPLTVGDATDYTISVKLDDTENSLQKSVSSLAFEPTKRVVLEEFTGVDCVNCPQGIVTVEKLHDYYQDLFIPMALHCYTGDPFSTGVTNYAAFLNLVAAPSGIIQRSGTISYPMYNVGNDYTFTAPEGSEPTWMTLVADELNQPAVADISATASLNKAGTRYTVPVEVRYALNAKGVNLKLFAVVLENGLVSYQKNAFGSTADEDLGEWGKDGKYSAATVNPYTFDHVVRGYEGQTFTGTPELLPAELKAGETYTATMTFNVPEAVSKAANTDIVVMLFDGNTDKLLNVCKTAVTSGETAIGDVTTDNAADAVTVRPTAGGLLVNAPAEARVQVYALDGRALATAQGNGTFTVNLPGYQGMVIAKVITPQGTVVCKALVK